MPDDTTPTDDETSGAPAVHDDIMKRLLDYQRQLRESPPAEEDVEAPGRMVDYSAMEAQATATATVTEQVVDLTEVEEEESAAEVEVIEVGEAPEVSAVDESEADTKKAEAEAMRRRAAEEAAAETLEQPSGDAAEGEDAKAKAAEPMSASEEDLAARVAQLEAALERIGMMLTAVRSDFQDLAIRADERIAEIESALTAARGPVPVAE